MTQSYQDAGHSTGTHTGTHTVTHAATAGQAVPRDRVRWGPILAGLFAAMSTFLLLAVLGAAIGMSAADYGDSARAFGVGAGIWAALSAIIAFVVGGALSAYSAATPATRMDADGDLHKDNSLLQGAMVWAVAIPLSVYMIAGGIGSAVRAAGSTAATVTQATATAAAPAAAEEQRQMNEDPQARADNQATTQRAADQASQAAREATDSVRRAVNPENVERVADAGAKTAWGTLATMLVGLAASAIGGLVGGKARSSAATSTVTRRV